MVCPGCGVELDRQVNGRWIRAERGGRVLIAHDEVDCLRQQLKRVRQERDALAGKARAFVSAFRTHLEEHYASRRGGKDDPQCQVCAICCYVGESLERMEAALEGLGAGEEGGGGRA